MDALRNAFDHRHATCRRKCRSVAEKSSMGLVASAANETAEDASRAAEQVSSTGSVPLLNGTGHGSRRQFGAVRRDALRPHGMARVGRQADLHRPCRGRTDGITRLQPGGPLFFFFFFFFFLKIFPLLLIPRPDSPSAGNRYAIHSAPLCRGIALPHHSGGPIEPERFRLGPFPDNSEACRAWISGRAVSNRRPRHLPRSQWQAMDLPNEIGHARSQSPSAPGSRSSTTLLPPQPSALALG